MCGEIDPLIGMRKRESLTQSVIDLYCGIACWRIILHFADDIHDQVSFWCLLVSGGSPRNHHVFTLVSIANSQVR